MKRKTRTMLGLSGAAVSFALMAGVGTAFAIDALGVTVPLFPAIGQSEAKACDSSGVTTTYTYGNTSSKGIKVATATVSGIDSQCKTIVLEFMKDETIVNNYTTPVVSGAGTMTTNIFTDQFEDIRVSLRP